MSILVDTTQILVWTGPGKQCISRSAPLRIIQIAGLEELAETNRILAVEPHPRRWVTIVILHGPPGTCSVHPDNASHIDLILACGKSEHESEGNTPLVLTADPQKEIAEIERSLGAQRQVSEIFVRLLRATADQPVETAMEMESLAYSTLLGGAGFARWAAARSDTAKVSTTNISDELVLINRVKNVLRVTLNDPARHNAYSAALRDQLVEALKLPILDESITMVELRGAGRSFCSGADLGEFGLSKDLATAHLIRSQQHVGRLLTRLGNRAVVHAHGACIGAGIEIPAYAHRLTAHPSTFFRLPELQMGLIPAAGGSVSIPRRIGRWRTLYMVLTGIRIRAPRALAWGLVDEIVAN